MTSILRGALAALAFVSTAWLAATPATANDFASCAAASGDEAIAACTRAISSGRYVGLELAVLFKDRCVAWDKKQETGKAIEDCSQAIRLNPDDAKALYNRGVAYTLEDQYDRAIEDYDQAIRLDPSDADAFTNRGAVYAIKGQYDPAIADFNRAIRLNPNDAIAFNNRGRSWERKGDLQRALADFKKFSELNPCDADGPGAVERVTKALNGSI